VRGLGGVTLSKGLIPAPATFRRLGLREAVLLEQTLFQGVKKFVISK
jgi:hypothetical protein